MEKKKIKTLVFDFGCVLVDLDKVACVRAFNEIGAGEVSNYVDECRQEDFFHELETGQIDVAAFCRAVRDRSAGCLASDEAICGAWSSLLRGIPVRRLRWLEQLKRDYRLLLLSNTNVVHWGHAVAHEFTRDGHDVDYYFERCFLSCDIGMVKPDEAIFRYLLREGALEASETLFIDDSQANCAAARRLGISSLCVENGDQWSVLVTRDSKAPSDSELP